MAKSEGFLKEKLIKFGTWLFLVFIFVLIVLSFGMPDFMGTSARIDQFHAAKVGDEYLTKGEVSDYAKQIEERMAQNLKGMDEKNRKLIEDMAKGRALGEAIDRKLFSQLLKSAGFTPTSSSEGKILANFYRRQFSEFIVNGKLDTERLNEYLGQRRMNLDQVGRNMLQDYGPSRAYEMLQNTAYVPDFALLDNVRFLATKNSYRIVAISSIDKDKRLRARFNPTEKEIQDKFKAEFLAKDPKAILDGSKRESIKAMLFTQHKSALGNEFLQMLKDAGKAGMQSLAQKAGVPVLALENVELSADLDQKKGKQASAVSLAALAQSDIFVRERLAVSLGQVVGPIETAGFTYFFAVSARVLPDLPSVTEYAQWKKTIPETIAPVVAKQKEIQYDRIVNSLGQSNSAQILMTALEIQRSQTRIVRYNTPKEEKAE